MKNIIEKINFLLSEKKPVQLHLGCGKRYIPGFLHIDFENFSHIDLVGNVSNLSFINDNSVDLIYACHVLEYFDIFDLKKVLKEWYRVLKKGSILRLSVPDFDKVIEIYKKYENMELIYGFLYCTCCTMEFYNMCFIILIFIHLSFILLIFVLLISILLVFILLVFILLMLYCCLFYIYC